MYVVAVRDTGGIIHVIVDGVIELKAAAFQAGRDAWNGFTAGLDYTWKSFTGFVSNTAAGIGGILDKAWDFVKELFEASSGDDLMFSAVDSAIGAATNKLLLVETNKEENSDYHKVILGLVESGLKAGTISTVSLSSVGAVADFLASTVNRQANAIHVVQADSPTLSIIEQIAFDDVRLVGAHETSMMAPG